MKIPVKLIKADTAHNFGAPMAFAVPWYYKLYWKMEGWLKSKEYKALDSDRGVFGRMLSDAGGYQLRETRLRLASAPADRSLAFSRRHKPLSHDKLF